MAIREVKELRRWHVKKSFVLQEGYHIWGRIVADKWLMKSIAIVQRSTWSVMLEDQRQL